MIQPENQPNSQPNKSNQLPEQQPEQYRYQRKYPRFSSVRLSHTNINRIKPQANRYNQTIDDPVTMDAEVRKMVGRAVR
jgi:hypothetical protein